MTHIFLIITCLTFFWFNCSNPQWKGSIIGKNDIRKKQRHVLLKFPYKYIFSRNYISMSCLLHFEKRFFYYCKLTPKITLWDSPFCWLGLKGQSSCPSMDLHLLMLRLIISLRQGQLRLRCILHLGQRILFYSKNEIYYKLKPFG